MRKCVMCQNHNKTNRRFNMLCKSINVLKLDIFRLFFFIVWNSFVTWFFWQVSFFGWHHFLASSVTHCHWYSHFQCKIHKQVANLFTFLQKLSYQWTETETNSRLTINETESNFYKNKWTTKLTNIYQI